MQFNLFKFKHFIELSHICALIAFIFGLAVSQRSLGGEMIPINDGFGWDGVTYKEITQGIPSLMLDKSISRYYGMRILPPLIINFALGLSGSDLSDKNILTGFRILNIIQITLAVFIFMKCLKGLRISLNGQWLGFFALFMNYGVGKILFYYPPLIDQTAFLFGVLILYFYVTNRPIGLTVMTFLGFFTYTYLAFTAAILFLFPRKDHQITPEKSVPFRLNKLLAAFITVVVVIYCLTFGSTNPLKTVQFATMMNNTPWVIIFSGVILSLYLFIGLSTLLHFGDWITPKSVLLQINPFHLIVIILVFIFGYFLLAAYTTLGAGPGGYDLDIKWSFENQICQFCQRSLAYPAIMILAHFAFLGPIISLMLLNWRSICRTISLFGIGLLIIFAALIILLMDSESRHFYNFLPFMVAFTVKSLDETAFPAYFIGIFALTAFLLSRIWYPLNIPDDLDATMHRILEIYGPWMITRDYFLYLLAFLATISIFYWTLRGCKLRQ